MPVKKAATSTAERNDTPTAPVVEKGNVTPTLDYNSKNVWVFESITIKPKVLKIANDNLKALNPKTGRHEAIRFCDNEDSIWVKEQSDIVKKGFLYLENGSLEVPYHETAKLDFLFNHPEYNKVFRLLDRERDAKSKYAEQQVVFEAQMKAMKSDFKELAIIARAKGLDFESEILCRNAMVDYARINPKEFLEAFDSELVQIVSKLKHAESLGIINFNGSQLRWTDSGQAFMTVPKGRDYIDYAAHLLVEPNDKNTATLKELYKQIG